ncbi:MAG: hypothetical protein ACTSYM_00480 [Candidatus Baldrarchaeia archaeon]
MTPIKFLVSYLIFLTFTMFLFSYMGVSFYSGSIGEVSPPSCDIGGIDFLFDAIKCAWDYMSVFISIMKISVTIKVISFLLFIPLIIVLGYIIISLIRGVG